MDVLPQQKMISRRKLLFESLPEMWSFQTFTSLAVAVPVYILNRMVRLLIDSTGSAMTSANLRSFILNWRFPFLLLLGTAIVLWFIIVEIMAQIYMNRDIVEGKQARLSEEIRRSLRSLKRFADPVGILIFLFIFIAVPICGIGFSISLTRSFSIPNFIYDVMISDPLYATAYFLTVVLLIAVGYRYFFSVHGILIDHLKPREAAERSMMIMKEHGRDFAKRMFRIYALSGLIYIAAVLLFKLIPELALTVYGEALPNNFRVDLSLFSTDELTRSIVTYRCLSAMYVLMSGCLMSVITLLMTSVHIFDSTELYLEYTGGKRKTYPERPKRYRYITKIVMMLLVMMGLAFISVMIGLAYDDIFADREPVKMIAHRAGGTMASENSLEGLEAAIDHGCYGSEIDVQRTADGHYIINHDTTFKRLTGVDKKPSQMTMEEIGQLRIDDSTGSGRQLKVATIEEMLDVIKGREKLFIELKGESADERTVEDLIKIIEEKDCRDDVVFISLNYAIIDYVETNHPEYETGTLFFIGIGDIAHLNCDLLIMEEKIATAYRINQIHDAGKKAIVWTVNKEGDLRKFLDSGIDAIISDEIILAEEVRAKLDERNDLEVIKDTFSSLWD